MARRPRVVWLLDDRSPTGAAAMTWRRARVLAGRTEQVVLALRPGPLPPADSWARRIGRLGGADGEIALARADLVITTSELTLASAAARRTGRGRLVHVMHEPSVAALGRARIARALPAVDWLLVPAVTDLRPVQALVPLLPDRVVPVDDFVLPSESLLSSAGANRVLAAGRLGDDDAVLDVVDAFALADLAGWQLHVAGDGPGLTRLRDHVAAHALDEKVQVLGPVHDLARRYLDAGVVVRVAAPEAAGLSVLEALAAGVPVVSSPASPAARHVRSGVDGTVLARVDPPAIAEAIAELADDERRAAFAAAARDRPAGLLDDEGAGQVQDLFDTVLDTVPIPHSPVGSTA